MSLKPFDEKEGFSRRELLAGAGKLAAGAALISAAGMALAGAAEARGGKEVDEICNTADLKSASKYPWPYKKIDPSLAADIAYRNWYKGFCAYASLSGIIMPLQLSVGEPYTSLPLEAFAFGHGGVVGWGPLCGTLFGSSIAASLAAGKEGEKIINDMLNWYSTTTLPVYVPDEPKATFKNTNRSDSPLCHISVGKWMAKEGVGFNTPQRKDRCARLSASVAARTVELLNAHAEGKYTPLYSKNQIKAHDITAQNNCTDCHGG